MLPTIATCSPLTENACKVPLLRNAATSSSASGGCSPMTTARITTASCESSARPSVTAARNPRRRADPRAAHPGVTTSPRTQPA